MANRTTFSKNDGDNLKVNLKEYFEKLLEGLEKNLQGKIDSVEKALLIQVKSQKDVADTAFQASQLAISKSEDAQKAYNARSNEFRDALSDANKNNISKSEYDTAHRNLVDKMDALSKSIDDRFFARVKIEDDKFEDLKQQISDLKIFKGTVNGSTEQSKADRAFAFSIISMIGAIISIIIALLKLFGAI